MTTHAKCPKCASECIFKGSGTGAIMCPYTIERYHIIDNNGRDVTSLENLSMAKAEAKQHDKLPHPHCGPHRVYKLVTLEEAAVIRAAVALVATRTGDKPSDIQPLVLKKLIKAVEEDDDGEEER